MKFEKYIRAVYIFQIAVQIFVVSCYKICLSKFAELKMKLIYFNILFIPNLKRSDFKYSYNTFNFKGHGIQVLKNKYNILLNVL